MISQKELSRIEATAINGKKYSDRMTAYNAKFAPVMEEQNQVRLDLIEENQATWVEFEGVLVLRVKDSSFVAIPTSGKKNSAKFDILNVQTRELGCQLKKSEVYGWLCKVAID